MLQAWFLDQGPVMQALLAGLFCWGTTSLGAAVVFMTRSVKPKLLDTMLGCAARVVIAASVWSLLIASMEMSVQPGKVDCHPAVVRLVAGEQFLRLCDAYGPHRHLGLPKSEAEGVESRLRRA